MTPRVGQLRVPVRIPRRTTGRTPGRTTGRTPSGAVPSAPSRALPVGMMAVAVVIVALSMLIEGSTLVAVASSSDARAQRAEIRAQRARVAAQVDALEGDQAAVDKALRALEDNVRGQEALVAESRRKADESAAEAERAEQAAAETEVELESLRERIAALAVAAYVEPPGEEILRRFQASSAQEDAARMAFIELRSGSDADTVDQLRSARQRFTDEKQRAINAKAEAEAHLVEAEAALAELAVARETQAMFAEQVRVRLDERLSDAYYLSQIDAALGAQIAAEERALADSVSRVPVPPPTGTPGTVTRPPLTTVGGITVNVSIADDTRNLLAAASAAGFNLGGYGYRDINMQIQLRRQNCGTSEYAIWQMPADQCRPPTARPGYSMHERGLAIDFTSNGAFINTRSNPAFVWLANNAGRFGFTNLPSEPWHWSNPG